MLLASWWVNYLRMNMNIHKFNQRFLQNSLKTVIMIPIIREKYLLKNKSLKNKRFFTDYRMTDIATINCPH